LYDRISRARFMRALLQQPVVERILRPARGSRAIHRFIRYSMVSVVAVAITEFAILVCTWFFGLSGIAANTIGCVAAMPASYEFNRKWAWGKEGKSHLWREVVPFWTLTMLGFLASTGTTQLADDLTHTHHVTGLTRSLAIMGASLFAWGVIWIVKFLIFNRLVFVTRAEPGEEASVAHVSGQPPAGAPAPALESSAALGR